MWVSSAHSQSVCVADRDGWRGSSGSPHLPWPGWRSTYLYQSGSAQDPTWPLDRYIDVSDPSRGFLGLKPGHPEKVVFAAITGAPIHLCEA